MPTYEYECAKCKKVFEVFQSINDTPLKKCQKCGGRLKKLIGCGTGIIFKGAGFYETDYKRKKTDSKKAQEIKEPDTKAKESSNPNKKEENN